MYDVVFKTYRLGSFTSANVFADEDMTRFEVWLNTGNFVAEFDHVPEYQEVMDAFIAMEDDKNMVTIRPDLENNAEEFWEHVATSTDAPEELKELLSRFLNGIEVSGARATEIAAWCHAAPGFSDGPEYARDALFFQD